MYEVYFLVYKIVSKCVEKFKYKYTSHVYLCNFIFLLQVLWICF